MSKQSSVEWFNNCLRQYIVMQDLRKGLICIHIPHSIYIDMQNQAQSMHKDETVDFAFKVGRGQDYDDKEVRELAEIIYNATFNTKEK